MADPQITIGPADDRHADCPQSLKILSAIFLAVDEETPLPAAMLQEFGTLGAVLRASPSALKDAGLGITTIHLLKSIEAAAGHITWNAIADKPVLANWALVKRYCQVRLAHLKHEELLMICLDNAHRVIAPEIVATGTVDEVPVCVRDVVHMALNHHSSALILAHNHPAGQMHPSRADIHWTKAIADACKPLKIALHDHLIVTPQDVISLKSEGYI